MTELIITEAQRLRMYEDQRISAEYRAMREAHPGVSPSRIMRSIAAAGKFRATSFFGIRSALIRTGDYVARKTA